MTNHMGGYLSDRLVRIGIAVIVVGSAPLLAIIFLARIGVWPDPDPNPIGPGLLFFFTIWPGIITMGIGILRVRARRSADTKRRGAR